MPRPAVSVVIPAFNRAELLRAALLSVRRQSFRDYETIVVDDGSTDHVESVAREEMPAASLLRRPHAGPAAARNAGIAAATAEYIAFLDSDDEWLPTKLERFMAAARARPECAIWYGPMRPIDAEGRSVLGRTKPCYAGRITRALFASSFVHAPSVVCRRALLDEYSGFDESLRVCEDYDLWLRISVGHEFGLIAEPLALRRLHANRLSKADMRTNLASKARVLERFYGDPEAHALLDDAVARMRIARVHLAAGRAALRDRYAASAVRFVGRAMSCGMAPHRTWPLLATARLLRWVGLDRSDGEGRGAERMVRPAIPPATAPKAR